MKHFVVECTDAATLADKHGVCTLDQFDAHFARGEQLVVLRMFDYREVADAYRRILDGETTPYFAQTLRDLVVPGQKVHCVLDELVAAEWAARGKQGGVETVSSHDTIHEARAEASRLNKENSN